MGDMNSWLDDGLAKSQVSILSRSSLGPLMCFPIAIMQRLVPSCT